MQLEFVDDFRPSSRWKESGQFCTVDSFPPVKGLDASLSGCVVEKFNATVLILTM
jgi:hypothetical protein